MQHILLIFILKMNFNLNAGNIYEVLFEEIPSDDNSATSFDDSDKDEDYCPPTTRPVVIESSSDTELEDSEILDLDNSQIYILPSPLKRTRNSNSQKVKKINNNQTKPQSNGSRQLFPPSDSQLSNDMSGIEPLPSTSADHNNSPVR